HRRWLARPEFALSCARSPVPLPSPDVLEFVRPSQPQYSPFGWLLPPSNARLVPDCHNSVDRSLPRNEDTSKSYMFHVTRSSTRRALHLRHCWLLPDGSETRPIRHRYSITSSASASNLSGTRRPSALAVFRFMIISNLVGSSTGRSAGFSPLRIRPA